MGAHARLSSSGDGLFTGATLRVDARCRVREGVREQPGGGGVLAQVPHGRAHGSSHPRGRARRHRDSVSDADSGTRALQRRCIGLGGPCRGADDRGSPTTGQDFTVDGAAEAVPIVGPVHKGASPPYARRPRTPGQKGGPKPIRNHLVVGSRNCRITVHGHLVCAARGLIVPPMPRTNCGPPARCSRGRCPDAPKLMWGGR